MDIAHQDTIAFVLVQTKLGAANKVAETLSAIAGVRWAVATMAGPYDVIAAVRVSSNGEFSDLMIDKIQTVAGIKNPATPQVLVVGSYYKEAMRGRNDFP